MTTSELLSFYQKRKTEFSTSLSEVNKQINFISNVRILIALVIILFIYLGYSNPTFFYAIPLLLIVFILLMQHHGKRFKEKTHFENLVEIHERELQSLAGDFSCFANGSEFIDPHHPYSHDLDIFGDSSLFQYLNRSSTLGGKIQLASSLTNPETSVDAITTKQQAVNELAAKTDFRHHFLATGKEIEEFANDQQQLLEFVKQKPFLYGKLFYKYFLWFFPTLTLILLLLSFFVDGISGFVILCAGFQWAFLGFHLKKVNAFHQYISRKKNVLDKYARLLQLFGLEKFESSMLQQLAEQSIDADRKVKAFASLVRGLDARLNSMTNLVVNSLLLYDLQYVYRLEKWKEEDAVQLSAWLNVIHETDVLCSLSTFAFNNPDFIFPVVSSSEKGISSTALGHPLLSSHERVTNDFKLGSDHQVMIITGANMAGKSTFLRTLGVNVVLALAGAPVCAKEFHCPILKLRSGMRTADSLKDHQSYFYAELDRLKSIMDELRSGNSLLILLDEILKGTNSTDKQTGSIALVKQLLAQSCLTIIATHDLALGELEKEYPQQVRNFCFEPTIENDQLSFDYKLKPGLAQKMNATFLMKKMGIIPR